MSIKMKTPSVKMKASSAMKDSGIDWIGEIPEHWDVMPIRFLFTENRVKNTMKQEKLALKFTYGTIVPKENFDADNDEYVSATISNYTVVKPGVIMINCLNLNYDFVSQRIGLVKDNGAITSAYLAISPKNKLDSEFVTYQLKYWDSVKAFHNMGTGVRKTLNFDELGKKYFPYPPIEEQRLIAVQLNQICGTLDNTKADIEKQIEILNEYKKSVMLETFEFYCNKYSYNNVKINNLSKLVTKQTGFDYSTYISPALLDTKEENTLPFLQTKNFKSNYFNLNTDYYIPKEVAYRFNKILLNKKSLLFSIVGASIGNVAVYPGKEEAFLGGAICKVDLINEELYDYIKYYMLSPKGQDQILVKVNSNAQGTITVQNVRDFKVPIFKDSINRRIVAYLDSKCSEIDSIIETKKQQLELLEEYKKSIIYEYVTGKREVTASLDEVSAKPDFAVAQNTQSVSIE